MKKFFVEIVWETYVFECNQDAIVFLDIVSRMKKVKKENYEDPYTDSEDQKMFANRIEIADYEEPK